jgi:isopentenyl-diphosphate delta-isomerase type 1
MDVSREIYDVVDADDRVIGQATRREIHEKGLLHRSVHILVFNPEGKLFLQKRSPDKDENPGYWDTSSAGHVDSGEDYLTSAHRELMEELGVSGSLEAIMRFSASQETFWEHVRVYKCITDQTIQINPEEISEGRFMTLKEIENALKNNELQLTSTFRKIFASYPTC